MPELQFDGSLEELARFERGIAVCAGLAILLAFALYVRVERVARRLWAGVAVGGKSVGSPYRAETLVVERLGRAPRLVRAAAFACFAFGLVFVPALVFVLSTFRFDGLGVPLFPGVAIAFGTWCCGWLLLRRSDRATEVVRLLALMSLGLNGALLVLSMAHFAVVEARWAGPLHECSASTVLAVCVFATASLPQALLMLAAVRRHGALFPVAAPDAVRGGYDVERVKRT
jgi:hypothetical protein